MLNVCLGRGKKGGARGERGLALARRRCTPKGDGHRRLRARVGNRNTRPAHGLLLSPFARHFRDRLATLRKKLLAGRLSGFGHVKLPSRWMKLHEARTNLCEGARSVKDRLSVIGWIRGLRRRSTT